MVLLFARLARRFISHTAAPIVVKPTGPYHTATVVLLHGAGEEAEALWPLASVLPDHVRCVIPRAPVRHHGLSVNKSDDRPCHAWADIYQAPRTRAMEQEDVIGLEASRRRVEAVLDEEVARVPSDRVLIAGFGQGGCLAVFAGLHYSRGLAGVIAHGAYLPQMEVWPDHIDAANEKTHMLLLHGAKDDRVILPYAQQSWVKLSKLAKGLQMEMQVESAGEACLSKSQIEQIGVWIRERLPE